MIEIGLPTASRACVRDKRRTRAAVDNPQSVAIALKNPFRTVLTSGATSTAKRPNSIRRVLSGCSDNANLGFSRPTAARYFVGLLRYLPLGAPTTLPSR